MRSTRTPPNRARADDGDGGDGGGGGSYDAFVLMRIHSDVKPPPSGVFLPHRCRPGATTTARFSSAF
jgi:hypothetical protein